MIDETLPAELTHPIVQAMTPAVAVTPVARVADAVKAGAIVMRHQPGCGCDGTDRMSADCVRLTDRVLRYGTVRCADATPDATSKCAGPYGAGVEPNPCTTPGSTPRCQICPSSPTYWRHTRDRRHSARCPLTPSPL